MKVAVRFFGVFRSISGKERTTIKSRDIVSLREAIEKIVEEMPRLERACDVLNGLETILKDEVIFIPVLHTG